MTELDVPCYNCICVPVCRNKTFHQLCSECVFVNNYLSDIPNDNTPLSHYYWIQNILKSSRWEVESLTGDYYRKEC